MQSNILLLPICLIGIASVETRLAISSHSFDLILRSLIPVPEHRYRSLEDVRIVHVTRCSRKTYRLYNNVHRILRDRNFDANNTTVLYVHGYLELVTDISVKTIENAYLDHGGYNLLILDWSNLAFGRYYHAATNVDPVAKAVGYVLSNLYRAGLDISTLHLVGHSLGAHIVGGIGRFMKRRGYKVPRITGLDPAGPFFYPSVLGMKTITPKDGEFVDIIHTDGGRYGTLTPTGDVDFYPNGGYHGQPGCPRETLLFTSEDFCSHWRSWEYFAESLTHPGFLAVKCDSYEDFLQSRNTTDHHDEVNFMGDNVNTNSQGKFYLLTASSSPYSLDSKEEINPK